MEKRFENFMENLGNNNSELNMVKMNSIDFDFQNKIVYFSFKKNKKLFQYDLNNKVVEGKILYNNLTFLKI